MKSPTNVRFLVIGLTTLTSLLLYLDRFCISFAERYIKEDLRLSNQQVSWVLSAFFVSYALLQVPSGYLSDRFGARLTLTLYMLLWSLFTGLTGAATGFVMLLVFRLGFGAAQAGAYPAAGSLLSRWVTYSTRGLASSLVAWGGRVGGSLAPILTATLIIAFVPLSVSSLLQPEDILNYPELCYQLAQPAPRPTAVAAAVGSANALEATALLATDRADTLSTRILERLPDETQATVRAVGEQVLKKEEVGPPTESELQALTGSLNELLRQPNLAATPATEVSEPAVERTNRLLLESTYPQAIRKVYVAGWRPTMLVYGLIGLVVAALFWVWFRDRPDLHPRCNEAEVALIENSRPQGVPNPHGRPQGVPLKGLVLSGSMWLNCLTQLGTNVGWVFLVTWLPRYLAEVHEVPVEQRGWLASIPLVAGWFGMLGGGRLTDRLTRALGRRWGRALPLSLSRFLAMGAYLLCLIDPGPLAVTAIFCLVAFATDLGTSAVWAYVQDVGGRSVGSVLGWGNMWGNLGGALSPLLLNWVIGDTGRWDLAFLTCAAAFLLAGVCALGVNAAVPIVPPEEN